jgi:hypothetical protein
MCTHNRQNEKLIYKWSEYCILHKQISLAVMSLCHDTDTATAAACDSASYLSML